MDETPIKVDWWSCQRKIKYHSRGAALRAIRNMHDPGLHTYKCEYGRHYHVGHHKHSAILLQWIYGDIDMETVAKKIRDRLDTDRNRVL